MRGALGAGALPTGTIRRFATAHDIVCLTETHLSHAINDAEVAVPGFTLWKYTSHQ